MRTIDNLPEALTLHKQWTADTTTGERANLSYEDLRDADLSYANLRGADLSYAYLRNANLSNADLSNADLSYADLRGAHLSGAHLRGAHLSNADLRDANLSYADLRGADLSGAHLSNADLSGTCLAPSPSPYGWATDNGCTLRTIDNRTLVLGIRTRTQIHMRGPTYDLGKLYTAPVFSRCPSTSCHPGLYVYGGPNTAPDGEPMLVCFWLDEMIITEKCRVPRFYTLESVEAFHSITAAHLEGEQCK